MMHMQFTKYIKAHTLQILFVCLVALFMFIYFIIYRTSSRVAWYNETHNQSENMIQEFRKAIGLKK